MTEYWIDRHGDVWTENEDGLMETPDTRPFPREHVEKKWGPIVNSLTKHNATDMLKVISGDTEIATYLANNLDHEKLKELAERWTKLT